MDYSKKTILTALVSLVMLLGGCTTTTTPPPPKPFPSISQESLSETPPPNFPKLSIDYPVDQFDRFIRYVGEEIGGGIVLMNGMGEYLIPQQRYRSASYDYFIRELCEEVGCGYVKTPYYYFLYPTRYYEHAYAQLAQLSLIGKLGSDYEPKSAAITFGDNTLLFNAFATISETLGITLIADNVLAETRCGELFLPESPLAVALSALCQSARLQEDHFLVESTEEYLFFRSTANQSQENTRIAPEAASSEYEALLDEKISLTLPYAPEKSGAVTYRYKALPLSAVLESLSKQLDMPVRVSNERMKKLPVNPCVMKNVRRSTALNLLIRQWPAPRFGYRMDEDGIVLCTR